MATLSATTLCAAVLGRLHSFCPYGKFSKVSRCVKISFLPASAGLRRAEPLPQNLLTSTNKRLANICMLALSLYTLLVIGSSLLVSCGDPNAIQLWKEKNSFSQRFAK